MRMMENDLAVKNFAKERERGKILPKSSFTKISFSRLWKNTEHHHCIVGSCSQHHQDMPDFMKAEVTMNQCRWFFRSVDHPPNSVEYSSKNQKRQTKSAQV
ncbi:unnamed protein product [Heterosigma akashiwo]